MRPRDDTSTGPREAPESGSVGRSSRRREHKRRRGASARPRVGSRCPSVARRRRCPRHSRSRRRRPPDARIPRRRPRRAIAETSATSPHATPVSRASEPRVWRPAPALALEASVARVAAWCMRASRPRSPSSSSSSTRVSDMSQQMRDVRKQMEEDKDLNTLMAGLRGSNIDDSDFAADGVQMKWWTSTSRRRRRGRPPASVLRPRAHRGYWRRRPAAVAQRIVQLLSIAGGFITGTSPTSSAVRRRRTR